MDYTAREDRTGDSSEPFLKHYIGIFNPKTSEVEIVEARKTVLRGTVRTQKAVDEAMEEKTLKQVGMERLASGMNQETDGTTANDGHEERAR